MEVEVWVEFALKRMAAQPSWFPVNIASKVTEKTVMNITLVISAFMYEYNTQKEG